LGFSMDEIRNGFSVGRVHGKGSLFIVVTVPVSPVSRFGFSYLSNTRVNALRRPPTSRRRTPTKMTTVHGLLRNGGRTSRIAIAPRTCQIRRRIAPTATA
jgi:hypothetical protein